MTNEIIIGFFYLVIIGALLRLLRARGEKDVLVASSLITLCLGGVMWAETGENLLFFSLSVFLLFDIGLVAFAPMLRSKESSRQLPSMEKQLQTSLTLWFLGIMGAAGLWKIWNGSFALDLKPVSKVFSQTVCLEFWSTCWPQLMLVGLLAVSVSLGALLMVRPDAEEQA